MFIQEFKKALHQCTTTGLITQVDKKHYILGKNKEMQDILVTSAQPFFYSYYKIVTILKVSDWLNLSLQRNIFYFLFQTSRSWDEKKIMHEAQKQIVCEMNSQFIHPYSLSLDTYSHCLSALTDLNAVKRIRK